MKQTMAHTSGSQPRRALTGPFPEVDTKASTIAAEVRPPLQEESIAQLRTRSVLKHRVAWIGGFGSPAAIRSRLPAECELVAVCDIKEDVLIRSRLEAPDILVTDDFHEIARMSDCDSVISYTPNETHRNIAVACLAGGKNVFIEKPMGITLKQGQEILAAEQQSGKYVGVDLEFRCSRIGQAVRQIIDSGEIGEIRQVEVDHHRGGWLNDSPAGCYRTKRKTSGLFKMEGIHALDLLRYWVGEIAQCRMFAAPNILPHYEFPDNATVMFQFENGASGRYSCSHNKVAYSAGHDTAKGARLGHMYRFTLAGSKGVIDIDFWHGYVNVMLLQASPVGTESLKPEFERRIDFSGLPNPMAAGHDIDRCRNEFLRRMAAGLPPIQAASDAYRTEQLAFALDDCTDLSGGLIDCKR